MRSVTRRTTGRSWRRCLEGELLIRRGASHERRCTAQRGARQLRKDRMGRLLSRVPRGAGGRVGRAGTRLRSASRRRAGAGRGGARRRTLVCCRAAAHQGRVPARGRGRSVRADGRRLLRRVRSTWQGSKAPCSGSCGPPTGLARLRSQAGSAGGWQTSPCACIRPVHGRLRDGGPEGCRTPIGGRELGRIPTPSGRVRRFPLHGGSRCLSGRSSSWRRQLGPDAAPRTLVGRSAGPTRANHR